VVPSIVLTDLVGGKGPLESARELAKGLGEAVPTGALEEAEHPTDDRGGEVVASDDGGVAEAADRLAGSLGVELDAGPVRHPLDPPTTVFVNAHGRQNSSTARTAREPSAGNCPNA